MPISTVCPHCGKSINVNANKYETDSVPCPKCNRPVRKFYNLNCPKCSKQIKVSWGKVRRGMASCKGCRKKITKSDLPLEQTSATQPQAQPMPQMPATSFRQTGVLCLSCMNVTPLGNKKCQNCRNKLKVKPITMVYFDGNNEAIQCQKCGGFTHFRSVKCQKCGKKIKF